MHVDMGGGNRATILGTSRRADQVRHYTRQEGWTGRCLVTPF